MFLKSDDDIFREGYFEIFNKKKEEINIKEENLNSLWLENKEGDKWIPSDDYFNNQIGPSDYIYQVSEFPCTLQRMYLKMVDQEEVNKCPHPEETIIPTFGWIEGLEGRECKKCYGSQLKNEGEPWPSGWRANGSRKVGVSNSSWSADLVAAIARPSIKEKIKSLVRGYWAKRYDMNKAILISANSCERCMNALAHRYGLNWGYREGSSSWKKAGTLCEFCS